MPDDLGDFDLEPTRRQGDEETMGAYRPDPEKKGGHRRAWLYTFLDDLGSRVAAALPAGEKKKMVKAHAPGAEGVPGAVPEVFPAD